MLTLIKLVVECFSYHFCKCKTCCCLRKHYPVKGHRCLHRLGLHCVWTEEANPNWYLGGWHFLLLCAFILIFLRCQHTTSVLQMRPWLFICACYPTRLYTHMSTVIIERVCECLWHTLTYTMPCPMHLLHAFMPFFLKLGFRGAVQGMFNNTIL